MSTESLLYLRQRAAISALSLAVNRRISKVGATGALTARTFLWLPKTLSELPLLSAPAAMKRLFMDSDGSPASCPPGTTTM